MAIGSPFLVTLRSTLVMMPAKVQIEPFSASANIAVVVVEYLFKDDS